MLVPGLSSDQAEAVAFISALFAGKPPELWIYLWEARTKRTSWFQSIDQAALYGAGRTDIYVGCSLSSKDHGPTMRVKAEQSAGITGFWADIDFAGPAHKATDLPPDSNAAANLLDEFPHKPTLTVHSGHGLQAWWLFDRPWIFDSTADRTSAAKASQAVQDCLRGIAAQRGWRVDSVGDLARVLRLPGSRNGKTDPPLECLLLEDTGPRYARSEWRLDGRPTALETSTRRNGRPAAKPEEINGFPESNTIIGRAPDEWEAIASGVGEGERNATAAAWIGKLASRTSDLDDTEFEWLTTRIWNERNRPPLPDKELRSTFRSIFAAEARRRARTNLEAEVRHISKIDTEPGTRAWRLRIIDSRPPVYELESPYWDGGVRLTADQYLHWHKLRIVAIEKTGQWLPEELGKLWSKTPRDGMPLAAALLEAAEHVTASPYESDDTRLFERIQLILADARTTRVKDDGTENVPTEEIRRSVQVVDGGVGVGFRWLARSINLDVVDRVTEREIARAIAEIGGKIVTRNAQSGRKVRYLLFDHEALERLTQRVPSEG